MDDCILKMDDDGQQVEPIYYGPIIPMILVNGSVGIGTDLVHLFHAIIRFILLIG